MTRNAKKAFVQSLIPSGFIFMFLLLAAFVSSAFAAEGAPAPASAKAETQIDAKAILDQLDSLWRGDSSKGTMSMHIKKKHWERTLTMEMWTKGDEKTLVRVLKPLKERGTSTLKVGKEIYNYLPKTDRTIKLTSAMMGGSWMGSHFTNDDLVKEDQMADDFTNTVSFVGEREGQQIIELTLIPNPDAAVVWGKVTVEVRAKDKQPIRFTYFDEDGEKSRWMSFSKYEMVSGRLMPLELKMTPADEPDEFTQIIYEDISFNVDLPDSIFSLANLRH